jgi:glycosyltransferase involved in cell wall biosynthesis
MDNNNKLHVVIVNDAAHITGGAGLVALSSAIGLAREGCRVTVFSALGPVMGELRDCPNLQVICLGQQDIITNPNRLTAAIQGIWNKEAAFHMKKLLATLSPSGTVVHVHNWTKGLSASVVKAANELGFKVVLTLHDYFVGCPNGVFFNYLMKESCSLRAQSPGCVISDCDRMSYRHKSWRILRQLVQKHVLGFPDDIKFFITVSRFSANILRPYLPPNAFVLHVDNPTQVVQHDPVKVEDNDAFMGIGRMGTEKGFHLFAQAAHRMGVKAVIVGDGEMRRQIERKYPGVQITGWLERRMVVEALKTARCLVSPSLCYETHGLVVMEAAACGVPAIVTNKSAARDVVEDGITGLYFRSGDVEDLAEKMKIMLAEETAAAMGKAAYHRFWSKPPTLEAHLQGLHEVYSRMLESRAY